MKRAAGVALSVTATIAVLLVFGTRPAGDRGHLPRAAALATIRAIHSAQVEYSSRYGRFATSLAELGVSASDAGYRFVLTGAANGYRLTALPVAGGRSFFSDQTMVVRVSDGPEPATASSRELSAR
jgi:hypothetical protein